MVALFGDLMVSRWEILGVEKTCCRR
jgi:DNA-directed RNA polymerase subunit N (RpoN/RPB10)